MWNDLSGESPGDPPKGSDANMDPDRWVQTPQTVDNNRAYSREVLEVNQKLHAEVEIKKESKPKKKIHNLKPQPVDNDFQKYSSEEIRERNELKVEAQDYHLYMSMPVLAADFYGNGFIGSRYDYEAKVASQRIQYVDQGRSALLTPSGTLGYFASGMDIDLAIRWGQYDVLGAGVPSLKGTRSNIHFQPRYTGKSALMQKPVEVKTPTYSLDVAKTGGTATLYRNFGWNELSSIKNAGGNFSIHPNQFQGKQFWVGESGMNMWTNSSFAKPLTAKITVPKSFVTPGHKNYIFMESDMIIDGFPGGTVLPSNLKKFNSAMKIDWIRY